MDYASNLAIFLTDRTGSCLNIWSGKMTAAEQRALFGRYIGKGEIVINGSDETIANRVKVCFGLDCDDRNVTRWKAL